MRKENNKLPTDAYFKIDQFTKPDEDQEIIDNITAILNKHEQSATKTTPYA